MQSYVSQSSTRNYSRTYRTPLKSENAHPNFGKKTPNSKLKYRTQRNPLKTPFKMQSSVVLQNSSKKLYKRATNANTNTNISHVSHLSNSKRLKNSSVYNFTPRTKLKKGDMFTSVNVSGMAYRDYSGHKRRNIISYGHCEYQNQGYKQVHKSYKNTQKIFHSSTKKKISPLSRTPFKEKNRTPLRLDGSTTNNSIAYMVEKSSVAYQIGRSNHSRKRSNQTPTGYRIFTAGIDSSENSGNNNPIPCKNYLIHTPPPNLSCSDDQTNGKVNQKRDPFPETNEFLQDNEPSVLGIIEAKSYHIDGESLMNKPNGFESLEIEDSLVESCDKNFIAGLARIDDNSEGVFTSKQQAQFEESSLDEHSDEKSDSQNKLEEESGNDNEDFTECKTDFEIHPEDDSQDETEFSSSSNEEDDGEEEEEGSLHRKSLSVISESGLKKTSKLKVQRDNMEFNSFENFYPGAMEKAMSKECNIDFTSSSPINNICANFRESFGPPIPQKKPKRVKSKKLEEKRKSRRSIIPERKSVQTNQKNPFKNSNKKDTSNKENDIQASNSVTFNEPEYQKVKEDYIDGSTYIGYKLKAKKHGKGTLILGNGSRYEGNWRNDVMSGIGKLFYDTNILAYQGGFLNNKVEGHGIMHNDQFLDGDSKSPSCTFDFRDLGSVKDNWVSFDGSFMGDMKEGVGKWHLADGSIFVGEFKKDKAHGDGVFHVGGEGGEVVTGRWKDNLLVEVYN